MVSKKTPISCMGKINSVYSVKKVISAFLEQLIVDKCYGLAAALLHLQGPGGPVPPPHSPVCAQGGGRRDRHTTVSNTVDTNGQSAWGSQEGRAPLAWGLLEASQRR